MRPRVCCLIVIPNCTIGCCSNHCLMNNRAPSPGSPIESATPDVISTPLPGDGSLKPIGQHAYTIDLDIVNAKGLTHTATISYLLYLPGGYGQDPQQQWPLVLFLHGSGEWGDNPEVLIASGLPQLLTSTLDFPAIVLSPQAPEDTVWWGAQLDEVSALLDHVQANYAVDAKRIYLTGLSMGGFGAWAMALRSAAAFCGRGARRRRLGFGTRHCAAQYLRHQGRAHLGVSRRAGRYCAAQESAADGGCSEEVRR